MTGVMAYLSAPLWFLLPGAVDRAARSAYAGRAAILHRSPTSCSRCGRNGIRSGRSRCSARPRRCCSCRSSCACSCSCCDRRSAPYGGTGAPARQHHGRSSLFSALLAPIRMLFHTRSSPPRCRAGPCNGNRRRARTPKPPWREAFRRHGWRHAARARVGGRRVLAQSRLPVVAAADRRRADRLDPAVGVVQPRGARARRSATGECSWCPRNPTRRASCAGYAHRSGASVAR